MRARPTYTVIAPAENWIDDRSVARDNRRVMPPRPPLTVVQLSDHFGQYVLTLKCKCGHTRTTQSDEMRAYWKERFDETIERNRASQSLPVPIDLTEGQLAHDSRMEFLTCIALLQGQVLHKADLG
jgi:hypothetical protein